MRPVVPFLAALAIGAAEAVPLGHPDFYPSPERTIGLRGDGNGHFPGATFCGEFWEGTPVQVEQVFKDRTGKDQKGKAWDFSDDRPRNVVWKTRMPSWANSQPIVVGDRVFTTAEPDWLICCDARDGRILWAERQNVWEIGGVKPEAARTAQRLFDIARETIPPIWAMIAAGTMSHAVQPERLRTVIETFNGPVLPRIVAALEAADPGQKWQEVGAAQAAEFSTFLAQVEADPTGKHSKSEKFKLLNKAIERRILALAQLPGTKQPKLDAPWFNLVGFAVPVPVSDGELVYASFGQGQTVAYTLDGKRVWARYLEQEHDCSRMSHAQSMRLAEGVVVDMHGGTTRMVGLEAKTGRTLWEAPTKGEFAFGKGGGYYVASHAAMPLADGDRTTWVLVTQRCNIIRIRDGQVLGPLPYAHGSSGGPSVAYSKDIVYRACNGDASNTPLAAIRISLSGGKLQAEQLWETPKGASPGYQGFVALPEHYLAGPVYAAATGATGSGSRCGGLSNVVIGSTWVWLEERLKSDPLHSSWGRRRWDGKALALFGAADVSEPMAPQRLDTRMILGDADFPQVPTLQELAPELYALPWYGANSYGKPMFSAHTDNCLYPQGDRLFVRTVASLYCLGDPARPWHTPASAPPVARTGP